MTLPRSVADVLKDHVTLEVEGIDRMYLNVYQPRLQTDRGVAAFFRFHRGETFASSALMDPMSTAFIAAVEHFVEQEQIPLITFAKGQRKDDIAKEYHAQFHGNEGIVFVGKAQEKTPVFRTEKRRNPDTGQTYPWIVRSTAMVNHFYFYGLDEDFGPFFIKFCTYFPYNAKLCINGHEYVKRQLAKEGIAFEALDNGILSCADPRRLQQLCDGLSAAKIDALLRKWLKRLPHPFTAADRLAGYRYDVSILQAEFSLTQVLDRPLCWPCLLRGGDPREPRPGPARSGATDLPAARHQADPGPVPDAGAHRGGDAVAARRLQAFADQAVPQGRPRPADRDHDQRHARLRHRQTAVQLARLAADRLRRQPTSPGRPTDQPGLCHRRRRVPRCQ